MEEEQIKEAFQKVKKDILSLSEELTFLKAGLEETRFKLIEMCEIIKAINKKTNNLSSTQTSLNKTNVISTSTDNTTFKALKGQISGFSTGNEGVSTDRQTDRQTDNQAKNLEKNSIDEASKILISLENLRHDIKSSFRKLTDQEFLVFCTIYQLEEENGFADYKKISQKLSLTESSIRDYVQRLIKKNIPIDKAKINNKSIHLKISQNLKKIAPLATILALRDL
jgi:hypothetical protein